jgi:hypothetical protein
MTSKSTSQPHKITMMLLLSLPTEILERILYHAIQVRGLKRGLRLRLVDSQYILYAPKYYDRNLTWHVETFARAVLHTLYTFRLLDQLYEVQIGRPKQRIVPRDLLQSYLKYRVMNEPANGKPMLTSIRKLAVHIYRERPPDDEGLSTVEASTVKLCSTLIEFDHGPQHSQFEHKHGRRRFAYIFSRLGNVTEDEYERQLLFAGICTNTCRVVRQIVAKNRDRLARKQFYDDDYIFPQPVQLAATYGSNEVLECLMTTGVPTVDRAVRTSLFIAAARMGRFETVQYLHDFKRMEVPWQFGQSDHELERTALDECLDTPSLEVLDFVDELRAQYSMEPAFIHNKLVMCLWKLVKSGNVAMVRHLLERGDMLSAMRKQFWRSPEGPKHAQINRACTRVPSGVDMVDLLIEYGMEPTMTVTTAASCGRTTLVRELLDRGIAPVLALSAAATGPYFDIVRMLLDAGVDVNEEIGARSPLAAAIEMEHAELFRFLLQQGADLHTAGTAEECVKRAKKYGLESMLSLLKHHGVEAGDSLDAQAGDDKLLVGTT